jgi:hypothetical protein
MSKMIFSYLLFVEKIGKIRVIYASAAMGTGENKG